MRSTTTIQVGLFKSDWLEGLMISEICVRHTLSRDQVVRLRVGLSLPPRMDRGRRRRGGEQNTPTSEEIASRAAEIRQKWTPEVERKRRGLDQEVFYEIPQNVETPPDFDPSWYD
jgi:hypothetical protein